MIYITRSDLTWNHITQFPTQVQDAYITEANIWMKDIAIQIGVLETSIVLPIPQIVVRYLNNYINYRLCEDSIASNNVEVTDNDMYIVSRALFYDLAEQLKKQIVPELLTGNIAGGSSRSISTGRLWRTA